MFSYSFSLTLHWYPARSPFLLRLLSLLCMMSFSLQFLRYVLVLCLSLCLFLVCPDLTLFWHEVCVCCSFLLYFCFADSFACSTLKTRERETHAQTKQTKTEAAKPDEVRATPIFEWGRCSLPAARRRPWHFDYTFNLWNKPTNVGS